MSIALLILIGIYFRYIIHKYFINIEIHLNITYMHELKQPGLSMNNEVRKGLLFPLTGHMFFYDGR